MDLTGQFLLIRRTLDSNLKALVGHHDRGRGPNDILALQLTAHHGGEERLAINYLISSCWLYVPEILADTVGRQPTLDESLYLLY